MPVTITKNDGKYSVRTPNQVHAKGTTKKKAESQARLLNAVEHGWRPDSSRKLRKRSLKSRRRK